MMDAAEDVMVDAVAMSLLTLILRESEKNRGRMDGLADQNAEIEDLQMKAGNATGSMKH